MKKILVIKTQDDLREVLEIARLPQADLFEEKLLTSFEDKKLPKRIDYTEIEKRKIQLDAIKRSQNNKGRG